MMQVKLKNNNKSKNKLDTRGRGFQTKWVCKEMLWAFGHCKQNPKPKDISLKIISLLSLSLDSPLSEPSPDSFSLRLSTLCSLCFSLSLSLSLSLFLCFFLFLSLKCVCVDEATNSTVLLSFLPWEYYVGGGPWCTVSDTGACTARDWRISRGFNAKLIIIIMLEYIHIYIYTYIYIYIYIYISLAATAI